MSRRREIKIPILPNPNNALTVVEDDYWNEYTSKAQHKITESKDLDISMRSPGASPGSDHEISLLLPDNDEAAESSLSPMTTDIVNHDHSSDNVHDIHSKRRISRFVDTSLKLLQDRQITKPFSATYSYLETNWGQAQKFIAVDPGQSLLRYEQLVTTFAAEYEALNLDNESTRNENRDLRRIAREYSISIETLKESNIQLQQLKQDLEDILEDEKYRRESFERLYNAAIVDCDQLQSSYERDIKILTAKHSAQVKQLEAVAKARNAANERASRYLLRTFTILNGLETDQIDSHAFMMTPSPIELKSQEPIYRSLRKICTRSLNSPTEEPLIHSSQASFSNEVVLPRRSSFAKEYTDEIGNRGIVSEVFGDEMMAEVFQNSADSDILTNFPPQNQFEMAAQSSTSPQESLTENKDLVVTTTIAPIFPSVLEVHEDAAILQITGKDIKHIDTELGDVSQDPRIYLLSREIRSQSALPKLNTDDIEVPTRWNNMMCNRIDSPASRRGSSQLSSIPTPDTISTPRTLAESIEAALNAMFLSEQGRGASNQDTANVRGSVAQIRRLPRSFETSPDLINHSFTERISIEIPCTISPTILLNVDKESKTPRELSISAASIADETLIRPYESINLLPDSCSDALALTNQNLTEARVAELDHSGFTNQSSEVSSVCTNSLSSTESTQSSIMLLSTSSITTRNSNASSGQSSDMRSRVALQFEGSKEIETLNSADSWANTFSVNGSVYTSQSVKAGTSPLLTLSSPNFVSSSDSVTGQVCRTPYI